ncbi:MAG: hypothetical protein Q9217_004799 [Psora testacea]
MAEDHEMDRTTRVQTSSANTYQLIENQDTSRKHHAELHYDVKRTRTHLASQGFWWLLTLILCLLCMVTIKIYVLKVIKLNPFNHMPTSSQIRGHHRKYSSPSPKPLEGGYWLGNISVTEKRN